MPAGEYNAPTLNPGTYTVRVAAKGFKTLDRQNVVIEVGKEVRVDLTPQPGEQTQSVTITEAIPLVDAASSTLGGVLNNADINDLPLNGRNFQSLMGLRPGVMLQPGGSPWTQSTNNVRPDETSWMVDGILNANAFDSRPVAGASSPFTDGATILPIDAIQEFNLMENPKAEYGGKPGAMVNVGIRSGTNTYHGSAYAFGRDGSWGARNFFNPAPGPVLPETLQQFGGVVGGHIIKDKLFFFAGYEFLRRIALSSPDRPACRPRGCVPRCENRRQPRRGVLGIGIYRGKRDEVFSRWKASIKALAGHSNVYVKLGGLGQGYTGLGFNEQAEPPSSEMVAARFRPYVETCITLRVQSSASAAQPQLRITKSSA